MNRQALYESSLFALVVTALAYMLMGVLKFAFGVFGNPTLDGAMLIGKYAVLSAFLFVFAARLMVMRQKE